jgi:hypothetical protein
VTAPAATWRATAAIATSQIASSVSNVGLVLAAAVTGGPGAVGAVGTLSAAYLLAICLERGLLGDPLLLARDVSDHGARASATLALGLGLACGAVAYPLLAGGVAVDASAAALLAAALAPLLLQDLLRYVAFARHRAWAAAASDLVWVAVTVVALVWLAVTGRATVLTLVAAWVGGGVVAALLLAASLGVWPATGGLRRLMATQRSSRLHLTLDGLLTSGSIQVALLVTAAVTSLADAGLIRFLQALFGPMTLLFGVLYVGEVSHRRQQGPRASALAMAALLSAGALLVGAAVWLLPTPLGARAAGTTFVGAQALTPLFTVAQWLAGLGTAAVTGLRLSGAVDRAAAIRAVWAALLIAGTAAGGLAGGAAGVIAGTAAANAIGAALWWAALLRAGTAAPAQTVYSETSRPS